MARHAPHPDPLPLMRGRGNQNDERAWGGGAATKLTRSVSEGGRSELQRFFNPNFVKRPTSLTLRVSVSAQNLYVARRFQTFAVK